MRTTAATSKNRNVSFAVGDAIVFSRRASTVRARACVYVWESEGESERQIQRLFIVWNSTHLSSNLYFNYLLFFNLFLSNVNIPSSDYYDKNTSRANFIINFSIVISTLCNYISIIEIRDEHQSIHLLTLISNALLYLTINSTYYI